jgi:hypothetical protein
MLNGIAPIIIFQFKKKVPAQTSTPDVGPPFVSEEEVFVDLPPIPIYLDDNLTGLLITDESKSVDAQTDVETKTDGSNPDVNQKGISAVTRINLQARKDSIGVTLLAAMSDLLLEKMTSKEYSVTYLNGAVTIFQGLIHSFSINQTADKDLYDIQIEISRGPVKSPTKVELIPTVGKSTGATPLG